MFLLRVSLGEIVDSAYSNIRLIYVDANQYGSNMVELKRTTPPNRQYRNICKAFYMLKTTSSFSYELYIPCKVVHSGPAENWVATHRNSGFRAVIGNKRAKFAVSDYNRILAVLFEKN